MADQFRDSCVDRQNKNRKSFKGNPVDPIRVSFYDKDGTRINDVTRSEANCIAGIKTDQIFYYQDGNGYQRELLIDKVNALSIIDALPDAPGCPTDPQLCGPPRVQFFGGMGMGAMANAVISPNSKSIIGFDIVNPGFNYLTPPFANLVDECGKGSGGTLRVQTQPYSGGDPRKGGLEIKNIVITAPGDGYLPAPNGSLGGNGRIWKDVEDGYVEREDGSYYVIPGGSQPFIFLSVTAGGTPVTAGGTGGTPITAGGTPVTAGGTPVTAGGTGGTPVTAGGTGGTPVTVGASGDIFIPPTSSPEEVLDPTTGEPIVIPSYPVVIEIEEIFVVDPGFGYEPGDTLEVVSDDGTNKGAVLEPVINRRGEIAQVKVISPGIGFIDLPEIVINSPRGYNAKLIPVLRVIPIADIPDPTVIPSGTQLISVVDCVGKILPKTTFDIVPR